MGIPDHLEIYRATEPGFGSSGFRWTCKDCGDRMPDNHVAAEIRTALYSGLLHTAFEHFPRTWALRGKSRKITWANDQLERILASSDLCLMRVNDR